MKYSLIILILVMSVLVYADINPTNELDKPATVNSGSTGLQIAHIGGKFFQDWTIEIIISHLINTTGSNQDDGDGWYRWKDSIDVTNASVLKQDLNRYLDQFPACRQLLNYELESGCTATFDTFTRTSSTLADNEAEVDGVACHRCVDSGTRILDASGALSATIYTGRSTGAKTEELNIKTSYGQYKVYSQDPIVLDLDGNGELEASKGNYLPHSLCIPESELVPFDMNADGFEELVEWVGANDGLLVHDIVNNEVSAKNLFGDATGFKNGFEQLATLDVNKDGALTGEELAGLAVWQDKNGNAKIDAGEIHSLESLGITKLNVEAIELTATFERNGKYYKMWDWYPVTIMVKKTK
jgi:hypothetical protein